MDAGSDPAEERTAELFDFLTTFLRDLDAGRVGSLEDYLARFPGCEEELRREYAARVGPAEPEAPGPRTRRVGPYRLLGELGRGGQGVVYLAEDERIARRVALKVLPATSLLFSEAKRGRLKREAEVVSRLDHPGLCKIYDAEVEGEEAWIAMPVVEGATLATVLAEARAGRGQTRGLTPAPKSPRELDALLAFFEEAARALHAAHEVGVVHRDVKPGNLMVTPEGRGVWLDFGQALDERARAGGLTRSGEVFGTPAYMAPEQVDEGGAPVDARADVWALGASLFEALTLERPFEGTSTHALLEAVQRGAPRRARELRPELPRDVEVVLATALERDLGRRYASARELAEELARVRRSEPILARPAGPLLRLRRWARRSPVVFSSLALVLTSLSVGLFWTLHLLAREERALDYALGRHLGERAVALLDEDPAVSLALGIEAVELAPSYLTRSALYAALERCSLARELDGSPAPRFRDLALLGDGERVAAALDDGTGRLYSILSGEELARWAAHEGSAVAVAVHGELVATAGEGGELAVHDTASGVTRWTSAELDGEPRALERLERGSDGTSLLVVRLATGAPRAFRFADGTPVELPAGAAAASPLAWQERGGELSRDVSRWLEPGVAVVDAARSPDGDRWAAALDSGVVAVWEAASGRRLASLEGYLKPVEVLWAAGGEFLVTNCKGPTAQVWFAGHRPDVYRLHGGDAPVTRCAFARDGERALTASADGQLRLWSTPRAASSGSEVGRLLAHAVLARPAAWPAELAEFRELLGVPEVLGGEHARGPRPLVERRSPDGGRVAAAYADGRLALWRAADGGLLWDRRFEGREVRVVDLAFSPAGLELAAACSDGRVRVLRDVDGSSSCDELITIPPRDLDWSPDGARLLVTGPRGRAAFHVQHLETGERMRTEVFHHGDITSGEFSPDGSLVLTSSRDGTIFVRDVRDGSPVVHLRGDGAPVLHAAFGPGPGPQRVIGAFADGSARVWPVDPLPAARARKPRELADWEIAREERLALPLEYRR